MFLLLQTYILVFIEFQCPLDSNAYRPDDVVVGLRSFVISGQIRPILFTLDNEIELRPEIELAGTGLSYVSQTSNIFGRV